jgi:hypothetical protein
MTAEQIFIYCIFAMCVMIIIFQVIIMQSAHVAAYGKKDSNDIESPFNACMYRDSCRDVVRVLDEAMVVRHLGVFNPGDDAKAALEQIISYDISVFEYFRKMRSKA